MEEADREETGDQDSGMGKHPEGLHTRKGAAVLGLRWSRGQGLFCRRGGCIPGSRQGSEPRESLGVWAVKESPSFIHLFIYSLTIHLLCTGLCAKSQNLRTEWPERRLGGSRGSRLCGPGKNLCPKPKGSH